MGIVSKFQIDSQLVLFLHWEIYPSTYLHY